MLGLCLAVPNLRVNPAPFRPKRACEGARQMRTNRIIKMTLSSGCYFQPWVRKVVEMAAHSNEAPVIIKRKKVVGGDGHHGGAWKVAYADFVTAMMAFFMLMWLLNATTEKQRKGLADYFAPTVPISRVSGGADGAFGSDNAFSQETLIVTGSGATSAHLTESNKARGDSGLAEEGMENAVAEQAFQEITQALAGRGGESDVTDELLKHIVTRVTDEGLIIEIFDNDGAPLFNAGSSQPTPLLRDLSRVIWRATSSVRNRVAVAGHIRSHPVVLAHDPSWDLSTSRAHSLRKLLETAGMPSTRIRRVTGHGDRKPVARDPMSSRNNRLEITLLRK